MNSNEQDPVFESLLEYIKRTRGFDLTGYKRTSLKRRVLRQMQSREINDFDDYIDYLQLHPEEFNSLFNMVLINVTSFFRDKNAWNYLEHEIIPVLIQEKAPNEPIRVWSAGCASGEEAYTLAIIFAELLGIETCRQRVKIYATDIDEEALNEARRATYSSKQLESFSESLKAKYFETLGENHHVFRPDLRRAVIFGRHDLVQDAPISRLDLLVCRNTLMYFNAETQGMILNRFHFALNDTGVMFLGKAEMLLTHGNLFTPINLQHRIFNRVSRPNNRGQNFIVSIRQQEIEQNSNSYLLLRELAFDAHPIAELIVDNQGNVTHANILAKGMFNIGVSDIGRPLQDLEISYRPLELRSQIERAYQENRPIIINDILRYLPDGSDQYLDVQISPLKHNGRGLLGVSITIQDVTRYQKLRQELQKTNQALETANEELQSSNEELETTNEELQSTNEELETTNEELQSTNEELETMNEELQSTNEELQTMNDELRTRTNELNQLNVFFDAILRSLKVGVVVIDRQFNILIWNAEAENLWGLRSEEVISKSILNLEIGLSLDGLVEPIRKCFIGNEDKEEIVLSAINRRGKTIDCRININPLIGLTKQISGVILLMEEVNHE